MIMQKPSLGQVVHTYVSPTENNGSDVAPATIVRVWSDTMVNLSVTLDVSYGPLHKTSVTLLDEQPDPSLSNGNTCWWPPRV